MKVISPLSISFECFPPKTPEGNQQLITASHALATCRPDFVSVTFGAGGSTREGTIEAVSLLKRLVNCDVIPHLTCIGSTRHFLLEILDQYKRLGVTGLVALRGDLPAGMQQTGDFEYASDLISLIREKTGHHFYIYVAAYPEFHPEAESPAKDILNLKRKYEAGANCAITQYFFNPDAYFYYLDDCERFGITLPVIPGIMPITQFAKLVRFSATCGTEIPLWMLKRLEAYGDDIQAIQAFGLEVIYNLCQRLIAGGAPGLHFYTLNKAEVPMNILQQLHLTTLLKEKVAT